MDIDLKIISTVAGGPAHALADVAVDEHADVIVVGTRGHRQIASLFIGSVTHRLLHIAPCPGFGRAARSCRGRLRQRGVSGGRREGVTGVVSAGAPGAGRPRFGLPVTALSAIAGVVLGAIVWALGSPAAAQACWAATTLALLVPLSWSVRVGRPPRFRRRRDRAAGDGRRTRRRPVSGRRGRRRDAGRRQRPGGYAQSRARGSSRCSVSRIRPRNVRRGGEVVDRRHRRRRRRESARRPGRRGGAGRRHAAVRRRRDRHRRTHRRAAAGAPPTRR